jgi:Flp pilus assembly protein TadD
MKRFSGAQLATIYFWRALANNKKGDYTGVIADATESLRLQPDQTAVYNLRGSAYYDKGEYDIAIADLNDAVRLGPPSSPVFHNRGNAYRGKGDYARALADYSEAIRLDPRSAFSFQNRGTTKQALGDLDGALSDINESIRLNPQLPTTFISRAVIWRANGNYDRAIADTTEAIRLANSGVPVPVLTPPRSWLVSSYVHRGLSYEGKGDGERAKSDYNAALAVSVSDAASVSNQATAKARIVVLTALQAQSASAPPAATPTTAAPATTSPVRPSPVGNGERRIALVIGNGAYANVTRLPNPPNDARAIAKSLRDIGFDVTEGYDLDRGALQKTAHEFLRRAIGAKIALLYYAGHGIQIDGKNFLVPVDVRLDLAQSMMASMTDMDTIMAGLDDQIRTNVFILDACRNNPMAEQAPASGGRSITIGPGLAAPSGLGAGALRGAGTLIAFATAPGQVALDGEGVNSPFSAALSRHVGTPGLEVQQMLTRVRAEVVAMTKNKQVPWSNSSLLGEVYLAGARP